jgi:DNA-binding transcriptional regulator YiaG
LILRGVELKEIRESLGYTQKEFGSLIGKTMRTIVTWEKKEKLSSTQELIIRSIIEDREKTSHSKLIVNEPSEIYPTKSGNVDGKS